MNKSPDTLTTDNLKRYFAQLIKTHLWSTVRIDLMEYESYGCPIFFVNTKPNDGMKNAIRWESLLNALLNEAATRQSKADSD
ncbi:hypothetical protein C9J21_17125 [Photobacterium phosphoreum]|nr:hypothetical protein C9J21_17125 [Photobacterium phosphoreum]